MRDDSFRARSRVMFLALCSFFLPSFVSAQGEPWRGGGPEGGWVIHLSRPAGLGGAIFAGTYAGGLYRSDDQGLTWVEASSNVRDAVVGDVALGGDGTLYAASEDRGLLRLDVGAGDFWLEANAGLNDPILPFVYGVETHAGDPQRVSASTSTGARTSRTRGNLWPDSLIVASAVSVRDLLVLPELPNTLHSAAEEQLFITAGWAPVLPLVIEAPDLQRNGQAVPNSLFDLARWPGSTDSMVVVDFEGGLLQLRNRAELVSIGPDFGSGPYARFYDVTVDPGTTGPIVRVGADRGLYVSHDVGGSWELLQGGLPNEKPEIWSVLADDAVNGELLLGSFVHGILHGTEHGPWQRTNTGLLATWVRGVDAHAGSLLVGTAHGGIFHGTDGETWTDVTADLDDLQFAAVHLSRNGTAWLAAGFEGAYRSLDEGSNWEAMVLPQGVTRIDRFSETSESVPQLFAATDRGVLLSTDDGANWELVPELPSDRPSFAITTAQVSAADFVVAVAFDPPPFTIAPPSLWVRDVQGSWRSIDLPVGFRGRIRGLHFLSADGDALAVAATPIDGAAVYEVSGLDGSSTPTFTSLAPGLGGRFLFPMDLVGDRARDLLVLATDADGIFVSEDAGQTWSEWNDGLITLRAEQLALDAEPPTGMQSRLALGTFARGAWVRESPGRVSVAVDGPWVERLADAVLVRARVDAGLRARLVRESEPSRDVVAQSERGGELTVRESLAQLRALGAPRVSWVVEVELDVAVDGGWTELARSTRDLTDLVATLRNGLLSAAPNPFNPRTSVRWEQEREGEVTVDLVDLRGRKVRELIHGRAGAGRHAVPWDGTDAQGRAVASGSYIVCLTLDGRAFTERLTLIR